MSSEAQQSEVSVEVLREKISQLESQNKQLQKALDNKAKQFENLISVYNLLIDKILNTGITN